MKTVEELIIKRMGALIKFFFFPLRFVAYSNSVLLVTNLKNTGPN